MKEWILIAYSGIVSVLTFIFGDYWVIFALYLILQIIDYLTGCYSAYKSNTLSSRTGISGILKKLLHWVIIVIAFIVAYSIEFIAKQGLNVSDISWIYMVGYFTLATLFVNELRSIIENLIECGVNVPSVLTKGLHVIADKLETLEGEDHAINK